ncbi:hypothetical protein ACW0S0_09280 [Fusobacterium polymorphum]
MLKAKFIDKILEVMGGEADRIFISRRDVDIYYKNLKDDEGNAEISEFIQSLNLEEQVEDYKVFISYEWENLVIHKGATFVCLRNFNSCNGKIWTSILEEIEKDKVKNNGNKS